MTVTVKVTGVGSPNIKAPTMGFASIILDDSFLVSDIRIIDGKNGLFVSFPSKKDKRTEGAFVETCHPLNTETRTLITDAILAEYNNKVAELAVD